MEGGRYKTPAILAATIGLILVIYSKTLIWLVTAWWSDPYYSHGILVPLISGYLIWTKRAELSELQKEPSGLGIPVIVAGLLIHGVGLFQTIRFASAISIVIVLTGIILFIYGNEVMKSLLFPVAFLVFMAPIPFSPVIGAALQAPSAGLAATLISALGIPATVTGAEIRLTECAFDVGAPRSIISLLTLAALYAYLLEGSIVMKAAVFLSALPIAVAANVLRITTILLVANAYGSDVAMRFFHDFSSLLLFSISLIGLLIVGRCFGSLRFKRIS